jgi:hypothetical protein
LGPTGAQYSVAHLERRDDVPDELGLELSLAHLHAAFATIELDAQREPRDDVLSLTSQRVVNQQTHR